jgi:isopenicillin-N epimerase
MLTNSALANHALPASMDWRRIIAEVEHDPSIIYLNTGTSGLIPKSVHRASIEHRTRMHHNPTDYVWRAMFEPLWNSRARLAEHLGTSPDRLLFFQNISQAINTFCLSLKLPRGSEILLSDHEYGSMRWAWERSAERHGWTLSTFTLPVQAEDPLTILASIQNAATPQTRLLFISHVLYTTGLVNPIAQICTAMRQRGIVTLVDGAHAPGMLPLDLDALGADFYAANLHKWFMSEVGVAFLYVAPGKESWLEPWQVSWGYHDDRSQPHQRNEFGSTPWIRQFEMEGTRDLTPWLLVPLSCDFVEAIGYEAIQSRHHELSTRVRGIDGLCGLQLCTPRHPKLRGGITAFRIPKQIDGELLRKQLWTEHRIEINLIPHESRQFLRVSTHVYNTPDEIDQLARAIPNVLR